MSAPWVAAEDSPDRQVCAFERAVLAQRLKGVCRACGRESAAWRLERRDADLVESYQQYEREDRDLLKSAFH